VKASADSVMTAMAKSVFVLPRQVGAFACEATEKAATLTAGLKWRFMAAPPEARFEI
jgi:hypothetical protein